MQALHAVVAILAIAGLALGGVLVVAALVELATGKPLRQKLRGPGRRAAMLSALCTGLVICIIDLTIVTGWNTNDFAITIALAGPAVFILLGLSFFYAGKSLRQRSDSAAGHGATPSTSHGM